MKLNKDTKILIVGLGLIGGSYAKALTNQGYFVGAISKEKADIDYALDNHIISSGTFNINQFFIAEFDLIIFALYPSTLINWIKENQKYIKAGTLLTDVSGVKKEVVYQVQDILRDDLSFVGAHPMAGRELSGVVNADPNIFKGANYIVTPTNKNKEEDIQNIEELGRILGFKNISRLSPEAHDEMVGFLSQLTHCIAISLMTCKDNEDLSKYTGDSFRDLTRIAKINEKMWPELFLMNKEELLSQMDLFINEFSKLKEYIANNDISSMESMMKESTKRRKAFDKR